MARLIILAGPIASAMTGYCLEAVIDWAREQLFWSKADLEIEANANKTLNDIDKKKAGNQKMDSMFEQLKLQYRGARNMRVAVAVMIAGCIVFNVHWGMFNAHSERLAHAFANPQIMFKTQGQDGRPMIIDDYREAYFWLRDHTPADSRVLSWWDYGYQITGIGNRTTLADGNTWNHEHIATIGYMLTSPVKRAHSLIRHVADYVLVWAGQGGDDLAKSPHMARIGNSVYHDICPKDPLCLHFGFDKPQDYSSPTKMMRESLLYNLISHNQRPGVKIDNKYFTEAYTSKHGLVRIFKTTGVNETSKKWLADPANRNCDAPGSWYCNGQYPMHAAEWQTLLSKRVDFDQLEDFNRKGKNNKNSEEYHEQYMKRMAGQR